MASARSASGFYRKKSVTRPGKHIYFAGRDEIAREICRQSFGEMLAAIEPAARVKDPLGRLKALLKSYADFAEARPETYKLAFMEDPKFNEVMFRQTAIDEENGAGAQGILLNRGCAR